MRRSCEEGENAKKVIEEKRKDYAGLGIEVIGKNWDGTEEVRISLETCWRIAEYWKTGQSIGNVTTCWDS